MGKLATKKDLLRELWLRRRNSGTIAWKTQKGDIIPIKDMTDNHLINTIKMIEKQEEYEQQCYEALASIGDLFF